MTFTSPAQTTARIAPMNQHAIDPMFRHSVEGRIFDECFMPFFALRHSANGNKCRKTIKTLPHLKIP
jgi:hypothetical protein